MEGGKIMNAEWYGSMKKRTSSINRIMNFSLVNKCNHLGEILFVFHELFEIIQT